MKPEQVLFCAAAVVALVMASLPQPPPLPGSPSDKVQHIMAFAVLTGLAALAFRKTSALKLLLLLSAFGALIEIVQLIPALHRDSEVMDWLADTAATAAVLCILRVRISMAQFRLGMAKFRIGRG